MTRRLEVIFMKKLFCIGLIGTMLLSGCAGGNTSSQELSLIHI